jgi:hypothetical protein
MASEAWHRRHAIQIAAALPDSTEDALIVLDMARELVRGFMAGEPAQRSALVLERDRGSVVSLSSAGNGSGR